MNIRFEDKDALIDSALVQSLIDDLRERVSVNQVQELIGDVPQPFPGEIRIEEAWTVFRAVNKLGFFDLLTAHGIPPVTYNLEARLNLEGLPLGVEVLPPLVRLRKEVTNVAGFNVDFPLGLPASILAANSSFIDFYAQRGFDVLTYKTVRTRSREENPFPNWVFVEGESEIEPGSQQAVQGYQGFWPQDPTRATMANSFGVPSFEPQWWQDDIRRAKQTLREGHQVLIVSVVASVDDSEELIADDFTQAAILAHDAGADIVEANFSCPNVLGDSVGELYQDSERSARVAQRIKAGLVKRFGSSAPPLFLKIGYLDPIAAKAFFFATAPHIDGIVAINTVSANVLDEYGEPTFPGRKKAGISGFAIKELAREVITALNEARNEYIAAHPDRRFCLLGIGGVLTSKDYDLMRAAGADVVETCTGAFLDPLLGLKIRGEQEESQSKHAILRDLLFELQVLYALAKEALESPSTNSKIRISREKRIIEIRREPK